MGSGFIPLHCRNNHVHGNVISEKLFRQGYVRVQYPIWLRGRVHISVNVLRRVAAKLAVHSAINVIIWQFTILSLVPIAGVGLLHKYIFITIRYFDKNVTVNYIPTVVLSIELY